ncbi:type II secretion system F family protein [Alcaligenaceae bacterium CGII-47]|nr:type II secretion system F family protein [Alcaligenaceae bacterium CGII-47]
MMHATVDWLSVATVLLALVAVFIYLLGRDGRRARLSRRLNQSTQPSGVAYDSAAQAPRGPLALMGRGLQTIGRMLPLFSAAQRSEMGHKLVAAGFRRPGALAVLMGVGVGCVTLTLVLVVTLLWPALTDNGLSLRIGSLLVGAYIGLLLPRLILDRLVIHRQKAIENHFPDALDLLVVCTNAGLGLNAALQRVADELEFLAPALADELALTSAQLQLSGEPAAVLHEMAERIGLASIRSLVTTLIQSRQFGTPIGQALRVLSQSERTARLMRTEAAAAKLAVKITIPMMLFILPTVLIVAAGPAVLTLIAAFAK